MKVFRGQIVEEYGENNSASSNWKTISQIQGWGKRYRVRIFGIHSEDKAVAPDSSLPWLEVIYPVTGGTGHDFTYQTDALRAGSTVQVTQYDDGKYYITGCFANNEQTKLSKTSFKGFEPFTISKAAPFYSISDDSIVIESSANNSYFASLSNTISFNDGIKIGDLTSSTTCEKVPLGAIQNKIKNFIKDVNEAKLRLAKQKQALQNPISQVTNQPALPFETSPTFNADFLTQTNIGFNTVGFSPTFNVFTSSPIDKYKFNSNLPLSVETLSTFNNPTIQQTSIQNWLLSKIQNFAKDIATPLKDLITNIQAFVTNQINDKLKAIYYTLFPIQQQEIKDKVETANDLIACLFRKIIRNLFKMIAKFLASAADRFINTPLCVVENFVGGLIGKLVGLISSGISTILQPLDALLGVFDVSDNILGFIENLLSSLSCDEQPSCPQIKGWSIWDGPELVQSEFNVSSLFSSIQNFAANVQQTIDPNNFNFDLDFSDVFQDTCNVGAIACGPPVIEFLGGGGTGASGNAIVNSLGQIIGIDITNSGANYTSAPVIKFNDACGNGSGAVASVNLGPVVYQTITLPNGTAQTITKPAPPNVGTGTTISIGIQNPVIEDPGGGYLPSPDGSLGGNGVTLTNPATTPAPDYPSKSNGEYPVVLKLCEVVIKNGGFNYSQNDTISITPSNGATAKPYFTPTGILYRVDVLTNGEGFKEIPEISIETQTGYNAALLPRLCSERVGNNLTIVTPADKIINVVDCPGR